MKTPSQKRLYTIRIGPCTGRLTVIGEKVLVEINYRGTVDADRPPDEHGLERLLQDAVRCLVCDMLPTATTPRPPRRTR